MSYKFITRLMERHLAPCALNFLISMSFKICGGKPLLGLHDRQGQHALGLTTLNQMDFILPSTWHLTTTKNSECFIRNHARLRDTLATFTIFNSDSAVWSCSKSFKNNECYQPPRMDVQSGLDNVYTTASDVLTHVLRMLNIENSDGVIREIEALGALYVALLSSVDMKGILAVIFLYVRSYMRASLSSVIIPYITDILGLGDVHPQSGFESNHSGNWVDFLKSIRDNWRTSVGSGLFSNFSKIFGVLVVAGLCEASKLTFSIGKYNLISPDIKAITERSSGIVPAICDIVIYFTETLHSCWNAGSFVPLWVSKDDSALEVEYSRMLNYWDLYRNGNLSKHTDVTEHDFYRRLTLMCEILRGMLHKVSGFDKRIIEDKFRKITSIIENFNMIKINSGFRRAPFCIEYYGLSSVGKSTICEQVTTYLFTSANLDVSTERKYVHAADKKHWDGARSDVLEVKIDDFANTKPNMVDQAPTETLIRLCNNVPFSPPMADLLEKGKVWMEPEIVSITTNVKELNAQFYSNNCHSIQRRPHYVIAVKVKQEFCDSNDGVDTSKVVKYYTNSLGQYDPPAIQDIWDLTVEYAIPNISSDATSFYKVVDSPVYGLLADVSMPIVCNFLTDEFHRHRQHQVLLERTNNDKRILERCSNPNCNQMRYLCHAHPEVMSVQNGVDFSSVKEKYYSYATYLKNKAHYNCYQYVPDIPHWLYNSKIVQGLYLFSYRDEIKTKYIDTSIFNWLCMTLLWLLPSIIMGHCKLVYIYLLLVVTFGCYVQWLLIYDLKLQYIRLLRQEGVISCVLRANRERVISMIKCSACLLGSYYLVSRFLKDIKYGSQGSLEPKTHSDISVRDAEENVWTSVVRKPLPITSVSKTVTTSVLVALVDKNLVYGTIHDGDISGMMNCLFINSNIALVPHHYFDIHGETLHCTLRKKNPECSGGKFVARFTLAASYLIPDTDFRLCYCATGGSFRNLCKHFPLSALPSVPFIMRWRNKQGDIIEGKGIAMPNMVTTYKKFLGGYYNNLTIDTFGGLCGAVLVSEVVGATILGLHLGGKDGTPAGCYGALTQKQLADAIVCLKCIEGVVISGSSGDFQNIVFDVQVCSEAPLHPKSPLNYMPINSQVEYLGTCPGRSIFKSDVKVTPISEHVMDVCGVPNIYGPPITNPDWYGWQTCLSNLAVPALPYEHGLLITCIRDYKEPILPIVRDLWRGTLPLSDHENLCGVPGKKFLDAIKLDTSIGFPLTGPKRAFVLELEPTVDKPNNRMLLPKILEEINRAEDCYRRGNRAYPIAKACKKDEILASAKCRIFYSNSIVLTWLVRKYYLPILRILQMHPILSECAVGINSHGPEWDEFHSSAMKYGEDRIFGGDYGKYDQKLPSQLIFAALRILIDIAKECGYEDEWIDIMEAMTGDIVFSLIAYNGDLIGLTEGTHISGNSLTVIINGICGSLNLRAFFYTQYPCVEFGNRVPFRQAVSIMTYGDDNIGSVHEKFTLFNIKDCSAFLGKYGQIYTMPDKESALSSYLQRSDFEFLKRKSVFHPQLGVFVGALLDKSIYKSLHCYLRPKGCEMTELEACAINIDGALREWFNHGEEKYEIQRRLMNEVAMRSGILHMCTCLSLTYYDHCQIWRDKYINTSL